MIVSHLAWMTRSAFLSLGVFCKLMKTSLPPAESQLHDIAQKGLKVQKTSRRDLAYVMTRKLDGSTTVSATMLLAARAGISVFVTGGIGISSSSTWGILQTLPILAHSSFLAQVLAVCTGAARTAWMSQLTLLNLAKHPWQVFLPS